MKPLLVAFLVAIGYAQTTKIVRGDAPASQTGGVDIRPVYWWLLRRNTR